MSRRACLLAKYVFTAFVALSQEKSIDFTKQECLINESGPTVPAYSRISTIKPNWLKNHAWEFGDRDQIFIQMQKW